MPNEDEDIEEDETEEVEEEEEKETPEPIPVDIAKNIAEGFGYLGGLFEDMANNLNDQLTELQKSVAKINETLESIKKLKEEQMAKERTVPCPPAPDDAKKPPGRSTLSETAKKIQEQQKKSAEGGAADGRKHPGKRGRRPGKHTTPEPSGDTTKDSDGGTSPTPEQPHDGSPEPDMGKMPDDNQSENESRE
jgi:uncharacterized coiled-coil protein SlyX